MIYSREGMRHQCWSFVIMNTDDLQADLQPPASFGVKLFEVVVLLAVFNACRTVKDAGDLLTLRKPSWRTWSQCTCGSFSFQSLTGSLYLMRKKS